MPRVEELAAAGSLYKIYLKMLKLIPLIFGFFSLIDGAETERLGAKRKSYCKTPSSAEENRDEETNQVQLFCISTSLFIIIVSTSV